MDCDGHSNDIAKETTFFPSVLLTAGHKKKPPERRLLGENNGGQGTTRELEIRIHPPREGAP